MVPASSSTSGMVLPPRAVSWKLAEIVPLRPRPHRCWSQRRFGCRRGILPRWHLGWDLPGQRPPGDGAEGEPRQPQEQEPAGQAQVLAALVGGDGDDAGQVASELDVDVESAD